MPFEGLVAAIVRSADKAKSVPLRRWAQSFMHRVSCPSCKGARLKPVSLQFRIGGRDIGELGKMDLLDLAAFLEDLEDQLSERQATIAKAPLKEVRARLGFLLDVGLGYLSLDRPTRSISGGEARREPSCVAACVEANSTTESTTDEPAQQQLQHEVEGGFGVVPSLRGASLGSMPPPERVEDDGVRKVDMGTHRSRGTGCHVALNYPLLMSD